MKAKDAAGPTKLPPGRSKRNEPAARVAAGSDIEIEAGRAG
jgi:hypothetical protein